MRAAVLLALVAALGIVAPASSVAPAPLTIVFANGDALGGGSVLERAPVTGEGAPQTLTARALHAAMPAVSPDGTQVAFASLVPHGGIQVLTLATRALARVTSATGDVDPTWTPDGKTIVFARRSGTGLHTLMRVAADGGSAAAIAGAHGRRPDVSADGTLIAFQREGKAPGLAVVPLAGGTPKALVPGASPSWSPDGATIAYSASVEGSSHLFLVHADGTGRLDITRHAPASQPAWSPDGTRIAFVTTTAAGTCCGVATVDPTGNGLQRVTHGLLFASRPGWAVASS